MTAAKQALDEVIRATTRPSKTGFVVATYSKETVDVIRRALRVLDAVESGRLVKETESLDSLANRSSWRRNLGFNTCLEQLKRIGDENDEREE